MILGFLLIWYLPPSLGIYKSGTQYKPNTNMAWVRARLC